MAMAMFPWSEFDAGIPDLFVEEAVIHGVEDFAVHDFFELLQVDNETGAGSTSPFTVTSSV